MLAVCTTNTRPFLRSLKIPLPETSVPLAEARVEAVHDLACTFPERCLFSLLIPQKRGEQAAFTSRIPSCTFAAMFYLLSATRLRKYEPVGHGLHSAHRSGLSVAVETFPSFPGLCGSRAGAAGWQTAMPCGMRVLVQARFSMNVQHFADKWEGKEMLASNSFPPPIPVKPAAAKRKRPLATDDQIRAHEHCFLFRQRHTVKRTLPASPVKVGIGSALFWEPGIQYPFAIWPPANFRPRKKLEHARIVVYKKTIPPLSQSCQTTFNRGRNLWSANLLP